MLNITRFIPTLAFAILYCVPAHAATTFIAATNLGPVRSTDGGANWSVLPVNVNNAFLTGQPNLFVLAVDPKTPTTWYATGGASGSFGFYTTTDSGQTWSATLFVSFEPTLTPGSIAIDPVNTSIIYLIANNVSAKNFIEKSTDYGATWTKIKLPNILGFPAVSFPDGSSPTYITTDPKISGLVYTIASHHILKSVDYGETWTVLSTGVDTPERNNQEAGAFPSLIRLDVDPKTSTTLYAASGATSVGSNCKGTASGGLCGLYKSVDNGLTWTQLGLQSPSADSLAIDPVSGALYAGGVITGSSGAIFKSTNGGPNFTPLKNGLGSRGPLVRLDPNNPSTVYAFAHLGFGINNSTYYRSTDAGASFTALTVPNLCSLATPKCNSFSPPTFYDLMVAPGPSAPSGPPTISSDGVVNGASFQPGIVPNSWVTIFGNDLASVTDDWSRSIVNGQFPTVLDGVRVSIGGKSAYMYFVTPTQLNVLTPDIGSGPTQVTVTNSGGTSASFTVTVSPFGPAFFLWPNNQPVATRQDFSLAAKNGTFAGATTIPAKPNDVIILWGTGFGLTVPVAPAGVAVPGDRTYATATLPTVTINNVSATVFGAALAPGFAGLYQVAIQVPDSIADGDWPIRATIGGVQSPTGVLLTVHR